MTYLRNKKNRVLLSILAAIAATLLTLSVPHTQKKPDVLAWWGTIYPEFCFSGAEDLSDKELYGNPKELPRVKISFWLAKALNW
ncbi:MAG: hypothetical protein Q4C77_12675 [Eubacteriales bacterium]|nr:hypothetical protein [Eubacteriales bacterium]